MTGRLILTLLDIMRLRSGPQDLPAGRMLALLVALIYIGQGFIADLVLNEPEAAPRSLLAIAVQFGIIAALLNFRNFASRINQTISALAGTGLIIGLISIAILTQVNPDKPQPDLALAYLALFLWSIAVDGHIYRHALSIKMSLGVLVAVLIFLANFTLLRAVFG